MNTTLRGYVFDVEDNTGPRAVITPAEQESVIGAIVKLDGRASFDTATNPSGIINYHWSFSTTPIGSQVSLAGFNGLDPDDSVVTFAPDITGFYEISLVVDDGSISSDPFLAGIDVSVISVPNNKGLVPDASFIWRYLSDFWTRVEERSKFEVFWSSAIQIVAAELLKQYQYDYNKSISDIQTVFQKRWINYPSSVIFDRTKVTGILAEDQAGITAATSLLDVTSGAPLYVQPDFSDLIIVPLVEGNFVTTSFNTPVSVGRVIDLAGHSFTMARSNNGVKAINEGTDGSTVLTNTFVGSGFTVDVVGLNLRLLSGADKGTYRISAFTDITHVTVTNLDGSPATFSTAAIKLSYTIVPATNSVSNFFADVKGVATQTIGQTWRFSSTIISSEFDFEELGVSVGDILEVELTRTDLILVALVRFQVVGVDRSRLSFVFNLDDLVDGTPSRSLSKDAQISLSSALQVTGLLIDNNGNLQYALEAALVKQTLSSQAFKRKFFETTLDTETEIDLGAFSVIARPVRVIRNSKIAIDQDIISVPVLQEYIRQPDMAEVSGVLNVIDRNGKLFPISHSPYLMSENLDYVIDDEAEIVGVASTIQNSDLITIPMGDLIDRSIQPGDSLILTTGATEQLYTIRKVIDPENLRVFPIPIATSTHVPFELTRRVPGKFVRFIKASFTKTNPCPDRLWAELTYFSNDANIEANFGGIVGVSRDELKTRGVQTPYKSVVEGLMYSLVKGPVQENLRLSAQILLGLPFAVNSGVITEINPAFRVRIDGSPLYGRILVEARDKKNQKIGLTDVYLIPQGLQLPDPATPGAWIPATPAEAGIAINPTTNAEYVVGDAVVKFAVLSKGVDVSDYISDNTLTNTLIQQGTITALLTQYHSFRLRINSDITTTADIDLTADFIRTTKPHYVKLSAGLLKIIQDMVDIQDKLTFKRFIHFFDNESYSLPAALKLDTGPGELDYLTVGEGMHAHLVSGDIDTIFGSSQVSLSSGGGFIVATGNHRYDSPFVRTGDLLIIESGPNAGTFGISTVDSDTQVSLTGSPSFQTLLDQPFSIYRLVQNPIFQASVTVISGNAVVQFASGGFSAGVAVGDILTFSGGPISTSFQYEIAAFDPVSGVGTVVPPINEANGTYNGYVWREALVNRYFGGASTDTPHIASFTSSSFGVVFDPGSSDLTKLSFIQVGDQIIRGTDTFTVLDFDPISFTAYVTPVPSFSAAAQPVKLWRPYRAETAVTVDLLQRMPDEALSLSMRLPVGQQDLTTTSTSTDVTTVSGQDFSLLGVLAGDFLIVLAGADSLRDIGYGPGIFPIQSVQTFTTLRLTRPLTVTNTSPGIRYGIQRRKPSL